MFMAAPRISASLVNRDERFADAHRYIWDRPGARGESRTAFKLYQSLRGRTNRAKSSQARETSVSVERISPRCSR